MDYNKVTGLNNFGNTCYLNSSIQLLFRCGFLNDILLINEYDDNIYLTGYKKTIIDVMMSNKKQIYKFLLVIFFSS